MAFPTTDWPVSYDTLEDRVDGIDFVMADDFDFQASQVQKLQQWAGITGKLIGEDVMGAGPSGMVSPAASGGIAFQLAARNEFSGGKLLSLGHKFDTVYEEKVSIDYEGLISTPGGLDVNSSEFLRVPVDPNLPVTFDSGRLFYKTGVDEGLYCADGAAWQKAGSGGAGTKVYAIVVGNSIQGDTEDDCDYLDIGDGTQLLAALTAASLISPPPDIFIKRGEYDLDLPTSPTGPLVVPAGVRLIGAGQAQTIICGRTGINIDWDCRIITLADKSSVENLKISCPLPDDTYNQTVGYAVVSVSNSSVVIKDVTIEYIGLWSSVDNTKLSWNSTIDIMGSGSEIVDINNIKLLNIPVFKYLTSPSDFYGIYSDTVRKTIINGFYSNGGDWPISLYDSRYRLENIEIIDASSVSIEIINTSPSDGFISDVAVSSTDTGRNVDMPFIAIYESAGVIEGVRIENNTTKNAVGMFLNTCIGVAISGLQLISGSGSYPSHGFLYMYDCLRCSAVGCDFNNDYYQDVDSFHNPGPNEVAHCFTLGNLPWT